MPADRASYLDLEAQLGGVFLHPGGRDLTRFLVQRLAQEPAPRTVLELGCGTGSTAALVATLPNTRVVAVERSSAMLDAARRRLAAQVESGLVSLIQADANRPLPAPEAGFDAVYAESVVALLDVPAILRELARVLRPGGLLILDERIWKPGLTSEQVLAINDASRRAFGIPAATREPWSCTDWQGLLRNAGFAQVSAIAVDDLLAQREAAWHVGQRLARLRRYLAHPTLLAQALRFKAGARAKADLWSRLECFVFLAHKPEVARPGHPASTTG